MSSALPLLSAAGSSRQSRSASKAVVKAASGFHIFRIDGYSLTKTIPGGEKISSPDFSIGGRRWRVDFYPNGTDSSKDDGESDAIALYLVYGGEHAVYRGRAHHHNPLNRVAAEYKFSQLDRAGNAAYELPAEKGVFTSSGDDGGGRGCGHEAFISKDELERRRERLLLKDDCLAVRCDVGVVDQVWTQSIAVDGAKRRRRSARHDADTESCSGDTDTESSSSSDDSDDSRSRRRNKRRRRRSQTARRLEEREYMLRSFES